MSFPDPDDSFPGLVTIDGDTAADVCWLLGAVEEFARMSDLENVYAFIGYANPHLSADGLADIAACYIERIRREARRNPR